MFGLVNWFHFQLKHFLFLQCQVTLCLSLMKFLPKGLAALLFIHALPNLCQRHILRDRRPSTVACPLAGRWRQMNCNSEYGEKKKICTEPTGAAMAEKNLLYRHDKPNEPANGRTPFICTLWVPFTSVSTVSRGYHSIVSLVYARKKP